MIYLMVTRWVTIKYLNGLPNQNVNQTYIPKHLFIGPIQLLVHLFYHLKLNKNLQFALKRFFRSILNLHIWKKQKQNKKTKQNKKEKS